MIVGRIMLSACALLVVGCASTDVEVPNIYEAAPTDYSADLPVAGLDELWWRAFSDPVLDDMIARGLAANLDIAAAGDRLRAAEALLRAERADRFPTIDSSANLGV